MKSFPWLLPLVLGLFTLLGSGCVVADDAYEQPEERRRSATFLTLVDESHQLTPEQLEERRRNIISYLVSEGYIYSGEDLVQSPAFADQIIRAKLALDGSFELTIYKPEHISAREIYFDPAGDPCYTYFPGDIGYYGDGLAPYYIPISPYHGPRHNGDRNHDNNHPNHRPPSGQTPDGNRNHQPPRGVNDRNDDHRPPSGTRDHNNDHRNEPNRPNSTPLPPATPPVRQPNPSQPTPPLHGHDRQPATNSPQSPVNQPSSPVPAKPTQPGNGHQGPDRQPWNNPAPRPTAPVVQPTPSPQPQPDQRRFRPEQQQPDNSSRHPSASDSGVTRTRPDNSPPRSEPTHRDNPPQRTEPTHRESPPPRSDPAPARDDSTKSDPAPARTDTQTRSDPPARNDNPETYRRR